MSLTTFFKSILEGGKVDIAKRYEILREAVSGTMSSFHMARDRETEQIVGLKILDKDKTDQLEMRFRGLDKPTEGEIASQFNHPRIVRTMGHGLTTKGEHAPCMHRSPSRTKSFGTTKLGKEGGLFTRANPRRANSDVAADKALSRCAPSGPCS